MTIQSYVPGEDYGTVHHELPEGEERAPSVYNEGTVHHEVPEGE